MDPFLRALYICYLSIEDPLVHTQVVAYLEGLARRGHHVHLLTFDPPLPQQRRSAIREDLRIRGIAWHTLRYHKRPSLPATAFDVLAGTALATHIMRKNALSAVHARNHVPAAMGLLVRALIGAKLIFDIRGLMAEEYVDAGRWNRGGVAYRITRAIQHAAIARAAGLVVLTQAVKGRLLGSVPSQNSAYVIPCCANLDTIDKWLPQRARIRSELGFGRRPAMAYVGKFTGRYLEAEMVDFFVAARNHQPDLVFLTLTQSNPEILTSELKRRGIDATDYVITRAQPDRVGQYLAAVDFAICFLGTNSSRLRAVSDIAASPTKIGEYLGAGLPILATPGIGDLDGVVGANDVGVVLSELSPAGYSSAAERIMALAADPNCRNRCRAVARAHFSLSEVGIPRYDSLYREVASR